MKNLKNLILAIGACVAFYACSKDTTSTSGGDGTPVSITSLQVNSVTYTSASVSVSVVGGGINRTGICYGLHANPTIYDNELKADQKGNISMVLSGLMPNTTYHVRAYAMTEAETFYSDDVTFSTSNKASTDDLNKWVAPTYADDYRSIGSWENRNKWNLANVHDPTVVLADDGYYYMYTTDAGFGDPQIGHGHFHARRSMNLVDWEYLGATMDDTPAWVLETANSIRAKMDLDPISNPQYGYWAPCVRKVKDGLYRMYYSIVLDNFIKTGNPSTSEFDNSWGERAFIGVMETADPASNIWVDKGQMVVCSSSDKGMNGWERANLNDWDAYFYFNAIDPTFIITPEGQHWLIYGSWHSGFAAVELDPETGLTKKALGDPWADSPEGLANNGYGKRIWSYGESRWQATEAPEVIYHDGYYYLFMASQGLDVPYHTRVARSATIDGTYTALTGNSLEATVLTHPYKFSGDHGWVGIAHCAIFSDMSGNWYYASQQRYPVDYDDWASNAIMLGGVRSVKWLSSGWPTVMPERYAAVPQVDITEDEIVGTWEHIDLGYQYGVMKESSTMTFAADGSITDGIWKGGKWTFDASTNTLTANGVELKVQRECDWEANPRKHTIVYAGINGAKSYWGKKK